MAGECRREYIGRAGFDTRFQPKGWETLVNTCRQRGMPAANAGGTTWILRVPGSNLGRVRKCKVAQSGRATECFSNDLSPQDFLISATFPLSPNGRASLIRGRLSGDQQIRRAHHLHACRIARHPSQPGRNELNHLRLTVTGPTPGRKCLKDIVASCTCLRTSARLRTICSRSVAYRVSRRGTRTSEDGSDIRGGTQLSA